MSECFINLKSNYLKDITEVKVVLPNPPMNRPAAEYYTSGKKFKVLWLLHGGMDTFRDWFSFSGVARFALERGMMLVMPTGYNSDYVNHPEMGDGFLYHDYFFDELMPFIYNWFPASDKPEDNFLAGNSMGCAAAWQYAILHPEKFSYIAPLCNQPLDYSYLEPYRDMPTYEFRKIAMANPMAIPPAYGLAKDGIHMKEINTIAKYDTVGEFLDSIENTWPRFFEAAKSKKLPNIYVPGGVEARDKPLLAFKKEVEALGIENISFDIVDENTHCFAFWEKAVVKFMDHIGLEKIDYYIGV